MVLTLLVLKKSHRRVLMLQFIGLNTFFLYSIRQIALLYNIRLWFDRGGQPRFVVWIRFEICARERSRVRSRIRQGSILSVAGSELCTVQLNLGAIYDSSIRFFFYFAID